jgi:hypothetical protein
MCWDNRQRVGLDAGISALLLIKSSQERLSLRESQGRRMPPRWRGGAGRDPLPGGGGISLPATAAPDPKRTSTEIVYLTGRAVDTLTSALGHAFEGSL